MTSTLTAWGVSVTVDLVGCPRERVTSGPLLREFVERLIPLIGMQAHGPCHVDRFGEGALEGWSAMQFITTSSIIVHLDEVECRAFIDIFSCKPFDVQIAETFAKDFFQAAGSTTTQQER